MVQYIESQDGVTPSENAVTLAEHLTAEGTADTEKVAKFLHVFASTMARNVAIPGAASSLEPRQQFDRSDLLEDTLVATVRKWKGVMSAANSEDVELFQFLAQLLMARGNTAAYTADDWNMLKERLTEAAFF